MSFASDTFTGTQFDELSVYSGVWSKQNGNTENLILGAGGTYVIHNAAVNAGVYQHSGSPASADYSVFADIAKLSGTTQPSIGIIGRAAAAANTYYLLFYSHFALNTRLYKMVAGSLTQLGSSYSMTLTSTPVNLELRMAGDQISGYINGVLRIGPATDSGITAAGKAGIYCFNMRQSGVADSGSLDNFDAVDAAGGSSVKRSLLLGVG